MRVKESIDFKRGQTSKSALDIGIKNQTKNLASLEKYFKKDFEPLGFEHISAYDVINTEYHYQIAIDFFLNYDDYNKNFHDKNGPKLPDTLSEWFKDNTYYILHSLVLGDAALGTDGISMIINLNYRGVRESTEFKRGQSSKEALSMGVKARTRTKEGLRQVFKNDMKEEGIGLIDVYTYLDHVDSLEFTITPELYKEKFNRDKKELVKFMARWLTKNTHYYLNDLRDETKGSYRTKEMLWYLDLKDWDNYDKK